MITQVNHLVLGKTVANAPRHVQTAPLGAPSEPAAEATDVLVLRDGSRLGLRRIGPDDRGGLAALFARLGPESRHRRFLSPKRELTPRELTYFTDIDHVRHAAFAAIDQHDGAIVAVARYVAHGSGADAAELAVVVADDLQRKGIGTALARRMIQRAHANGFTRLTATTLRDNRPARALMRRLGFQARASAGREIELDLDLGSVRLRDAAAPTETPGPPTRWEARHVQTM